MNLRNHIPNACTLLNAFSGMSAIFFLSQGEIDKALFFWGACYAFDGLDGLLARSLKVESDLGKQLDSLADAISFGALPTYFLFTLCKAGDLLLSLGCIMYLLGVILRLARFNVTESKTIFFQGLSSPLAALFVGWVGIGLSPLPLVCYPLFAGLLAFLMNAPLPLLKTKGFQHVPKPFLILAGFVFVLAMGLQVLFETSLLLPLGLLLYLLLSLTTFHRLKDKS
ncbi:MAG: CDP-alcohol phosphatidyltransferase family protein, partial [Bacteroidota bacterium]|nr:CDP-alcohol phosphatidyltransferase family protein [Bacteroidota bacterium]